METLTAIAGVVHETVTDENTKNLPTYIMRVTTDHPLSMQRA